MAIILQEEWDREDKEKCFFYIGGIGLNPEPVNNTKPVGSSNSSSSSRQENYHYVWFFN